MTTLEDRIKSPISLLCINNDGSAQVCFYGEGIFCKVRSKELQCKYLDISKELNVDFLLYYRCNFKSKYQKEYKPNHS